MNIYERISKITTELNAVAKNLNVQTGFGSYKAVSERDVKDAVKPLEAKYGVASFPVAKEIIESDVLEDSKGRRVRFMRLKVTMRFVNIEEPGEFIDVIGYGDGLDTGDKAPGKADTYAQKYCLLSCYKISTGDELDATASDDQGYKKVKATAEQLKRIREKYDEEFQRKIAAYYRVSSIEDLNIKQANEVVNGR